jgi:phage shock protein E
MNLLKKLFKKNRIDQPSVDIVDYNSLLERGVLLLDVRSPSEYSNEHIKNAVNIPLGSLSQQLDNLDESMRPILTYCKSGHRSAKAVTILRKKGIESYNGGGLALVKTAIDRHIYGMTSSSKQNEHKL